MFISPHIVGAKWYFAEKSLLRMVHNGPVAMGWIVKKKKKKRLQKSEPGNKEAQHERRKRGSNGGKNLGEKTWTLLFTLEKYSTFESFSCSTCKTGVMKIWLPHRYLNSRSQCALWSLQHDAKYGFLLGIIRYNQSHLCILCYKHSSHKDCGQLQKVDPCIVTTFFGLEALLTFLTQKTNSQFLTAFVCHKLRKLTVCSHDLSPAKSLFKQGSLF